MPLVPLGSLTLGQCVPVALSANAALLADLNAKLQGALSLQASLTLTPPSLAANLTAALDLVASLQASISLGLPGLDFQLAAVASLLVELNASLALVVALNLQLGTPGIFAYQYTGPVGQFGSALQGELGGGVGGGLPEQACAGWVFLATDAGAIDAASAVFA